MKKIKLEYWIIATTLLVVTAIAILISDEDRASLLLSGVALIVSSLAMGLSDPKKVGFNGQIKVWSAAIGNSDICELNRHKIVMHIINKSKDEVIDEFVYRLKLPKLAAHAGNKNRHRVDIEHGESIVFIDRSFGFLGCEDSNNFIPVDFELDINKWNKQNIEITISGKEIKPVTFKIPLEYKNKLVEATKSNPLLVSLK